MSKLSRHLVARTTIMTSANLQPSLYKPWSNPFEKVHNHFLGFFPSSYSN